MKIDPQVAEQFYGDPPPNWPYVSVLVAPSTARVVTPSCIPLDGRTYIVYGTLQLSTGQTCQARFRLNTTHQQPIEDIAWHVGPDWYEPYDPEALSLLGVPIGTRPGFTWAPYVKLCTDASPPYTPEQPLFPSREKSIRGYIRRVLRLGA